MARADNYPIEKFWDNGLAVVRGVFNPEEVRHWRDAALRRENKSGDLLSDPELRKLLLDQRVLNVARSILETEVIAYFGDSSVMIGETVPGFHKDNVDKADPNGPDWQQPRYPIVRFGLYTQDHSRNPDGLDLRRGSHNICSTQVGDHVYADTRLGDLVVWNLRTSHSGGSMMLKNGTPVNPNSLPGKILRRHGMGLLKKPPVQRVSAFWTLGVPGPLLDRYIACHKRREYAYEGWMSSIYDEEALEDARRAGVIVRDVRLELMADPPKQLFKDHIPFPY